MTRILLIENDPLQAIMRKSILERAFSGVERVSDPAEALCRVEQGSSEFDLVVCGVQRPGFGGQEFVTELHYRRPNLPVLVIGRADELASDYPREAVHFLAPPVEGENLVHFAGLLLSRAAHAA